MANKCIVNGCNNHDNQGKFVGVLCLPCHSMITTGVVDVNSHNFISLNKALLDRYVRLLGEAKEEKRALEARLHKIEIISTNATRVAC